ncbi:extracellular solute-binding protein [Desertivirga arenae]|uniref:extracellular solute-binding protein n=1 Tax=Desertivirga arenae TaxID=2810309 RepID=UPI001A9713AD|nr:extracellular solute-binding protein [Pedobacter sp. SYSU D00823]
MRSENKFRIAVRKFGPFESAMEKLWKKFCDFSGCSLEAELVPLDLHPLYEATIAAGGLKSGDWDVAHINTDWIFEAWTNGDIENLKDYIKDKPPVEYPQGWSDSLLQLQQFGEDVAGLPFHDGPECFIYRKDLFEDPIEQQAYLGKYGSPLGVPETWQEFHQVAQFFTRPEQNLYGTLFACLPDGHNTIFDFCLQLWTRGGRVIRPDASVHLDTPEAIAGLDFYRTIVKDQSAVHPKAFDYESVQAGMAFARGEVAMMVNWFGFASMCEVYEESAVKGKVDITRLPHDENSESASLNVYWLYTIGSGSRNKKIAYDFIHFATNQENDKLLTLEGGIGCRLSTWNDPEINKVIPYYHKLEMLHKEARSLPQKSNWAQIAEVIDQAVLKALNTDIPSAEILRQAQEQITETN